MRGVCEARDPDFAALHPGYELRGYDQAEPFNFLVHSL
jgi:hypothetical protein